MNTAYCRKGFAHGKVGKNREALRLFNLAIKENPLNEDSYRGKAYSLMGLKRFATAATAYKKCLSLSPKRTYYHHYIGGAYFCMKKYARAIQEHRKALDSIWPFRTKSFASATTYRSMGLIYAAWGKLGETRWCYEKVGDCFGEPLRKRITALVEKGVKPRPPAWERERCEKQDS